MVQGTVVRFNPTRGFGFIHPDDGSADVFMHARSLVNPEDIGSLQPDVRVSYSAVMRESGPRAQRVQIIREDLTPLETALRRVLALNRELMSVLDELSAAARRQGWDV
jgi:cold shock protein